MPEAFVSLVVFALVTTMTPGGATTLATASGVRFGLRRSFPLLAGIAVGLASLAAAAGGGLAVLLLAKPTLHLALKVVGSSYLLWLAWKIAGTGAPGTGPGAATIPTGFWTGVLLLWLNPKGWATALGAAASFAALTASPLHLAVLLATVLGLSAVASMVLWCIGGLLLARILRTERQWRVVNAALGLLLAASILPIWLE